MISTVFSLVNAILFHPFPYKDAERLVYLLETNPRAGYTNTVSMANFLDWKKQSNTFEAMALIGGDHAILTGGTEPERLRGICVSSEMSSLLGFSPRLGRTFLPGENLPGADQTVLISHGFWQRRFGTRPDILGQSMILNGQPHWVVGILPIQLKMGYLLGFEPDYWKPLPLAEQREKRSDRAFLALARLKPGVGKEQAQTDLAFIAGQLEKQYPQSNREWGVLVSDLRGNVDPAVYLFILIAIAAILGIVCVNVTNLLLARASAREREIAIRSALGASRKRLVRQVLRDRKSVV
jgi:putative ABC transport system permease protein